MEKVWVIYLAVGERPMPVEIEPTLEAQQALVGGLIEPVEIDDSGLSWVVNDSGMIDCLPFNVCLPNVGQLFGNLYVGRWKDGEIVSTTPEDHKLVCETLRAAGRL